MSRRAFERWDWACYVASGRLTPAQRAVLQVVARHVGEASGARISQATMAASTGITDRGVRKVLGRLEELGLIVSDPQPGKPTIWALNLDWTPEPQFQGSVSPTPERPRNDPGTKSSYEGEGEETPSSPSTSTRDVEGGRVNETIIDLARAVSMRRAVRR